MTDIYKQSHEVRNDQWHSEAFWPTPSSKENNILKSASETYCWLLGRDCSFVLLFVILHPTVEVTLRKWVKSVKSMRLLCCCFFFLSSDITAIPRYWLFVSSTKDRTEKTPFNGLNIWVMISVIYSLQRCWRAWSSLCVCVCGQKRLIHDTAKKSEGETCKWI